jgi:FeS assembly SUF system protein
MMTKLMEQIDPELAVDLENRVYDVLKSIYDPEIPVNIYELGLIYEVAVTPFADVHIRMTLTSPNCPVAGSLPGEIQAKVEIIPEVRECEVEITFDPPWDQSMMSEEARLELGFM